MTLRLVRIALGKDCTIGVFIASGEYVCMALEPPWLENRRNVSCIPCGTYPLKRYKHRTRGDVWRVEGVPDRSGILIHPGNSVEDTRGCILPGVYVTGPAGARRLVGSVAALELLSARLDLYAEQSLTVSDVYGG